MNNVNVLIWGTAKDGACAYFRGHLFDEPLAAQGVNLRHISNVSFTRMEDGRITLDTTDLDWADVLVYRRYYNTALRCGEQGGKCNFLTQDGALAAAHEHGWKRQDDITRTLWPMVRDHWDGALIYETDDDHFAIKPWNGYYGDVKMEHDMIADMARRADLLTASTPILAARYSRFNPRTRVIRNAVDPDLYAKTSPRREGRDPRLVYYGSTARMRDYAGYPDERGKWIGGYSRAAVDEVKARYGLQRVFLGTNPQTEHIIGAMFDEQTPYIESIPAFSRALANVHGDIGIAPLLGDNFDQAKSELHWLEYALADMAFIGERFMGDGPYQVIRHGVDGLLARGRGEWYESIRKLATSQTLREELAGAAKERVLRDYDYRVRAHEWADAFRWAAEHAGIGKRKAAA